MYDWEPDFYDDPENLPSDMPSSLKDYIGNATLQEVRIKKESFDVSFIIVSADFDQN